jgi:excisionase family DNA binding protein
MLRNSILPGGCYVDKEKRRANEEAVEDRLVPVPDAAGRLGVSRATVYSLMGAGELPYVKVGRSRRVSLAALREYVERNTFAGAR